MTLFPKDSVQDLILRGFCQDEILAKTGVDPGYHNSKFKTELSGYDRTEYKALFVRTEFAQTVILDVLRDYADGMVSEDVQARFGLGTGQVLRLKNLFGKMGLVDEFRDADRKHRKGVMRSGMQAKYGTDNPFKLTEFQDKAAETRLDRYGARYTLASESALEPAARAKSSAAAGTEETKHRRKQTMLERYGVEYSSQSSEVLEKRRQTTLQRYGAEHWSQSDVGRASISARMRGTSHKGVPCSEAGKQRISEYMKAHPEVLEKAQHTLIDRYGVPCGYQSPKARERSRETHRTHREEIQEKTRATMLQRYGVAHYSQTEEGRQRLSEEMYDRMSDLDVRQEYFQKAIASKRKNGTFSTSEPEEKLYLMLVSCFGEDDVERQYWSDEYPFCCDFYVKSRNLYIELNGTWMHGGHWYGSSSQDDLVLGKWQAKGSEFYQTASHIWSESDVAKREVARVSSLNYIVFWDTKLLDAELWIASGCPDGQDWEREYSWIPRRTIVCDIDFPGKLGAPISFMRAAKAGNGLAFYCRELTLWNEDAGYKVGRVQGFLFANRLKYLGKLPDELSDFEVLRGMGIAGVIRGYTSYDVSVMLGLCRKLGIKSVYDPCSGWGERLTACGYLGIKYRGCDINPVLQDGYAKIVSYYGFNDVETVCGDAALLDVTSGDHDAVFTCPPYGGTEVYTDVGAENLDEPVFLDWWRQVVRHAAGPQTRYFIYQIDCKHKDDMNQVLLDEGWTFVEEVMSGTNKVRHENRAQGKMKKENYEAVQIFCR